MTTSARPEAERTPLNSGLALERGPCGVGSAIHRVPRRIPAATTTSPRNTSRQAVAGSSPRIGPTAMPAPATPPSTPRSLGRCPESCRRVSARVPGKHQRGPDPLKDRPAERKRRHAPGGPVSADPVAIQMPMMKARRRPMMSPTLPPVSISAARECRRVQRDHRLDRGHCGVEVLDQLRDRHVHHRLVQDHQELSGPQNRQYFDSASRES